MRDGEGRKEILSHWQGRLDAQQCYVLRWEGWQVNEAILGGGRDTMEIKSSFLNV